MDADFIILLVEDNPGDVRLTREALRNGKIQHTLYAVQDGLEALEFLRRVGRFASAPRPDLILLDLNLPRLDGRELLAEIKADPDLARIPAVVLSNSQDEGDIRAAYDHYANGYIVKPVDVEQFFQVMRGLKQFWMAVVQLPHQN